MKFMINSANKLVEEFVWLRFYLIFMIHQQLKEMNILKLLDQ